MQAPGVSYRFNISIPAGCTPYTSTCTFYAALRTNVNSSEWLDYYMEGAATGYLALGWNNVSQTVSKLSLKFESAAVWSIEMQVTILRILPPSVRCVKTGYTQLLLQFQ